MASPAMHPHTGGGRQPTLQIPPCSTDRRKRAHRPRNSKEAAHHRARRSARSSVTHGADTMATSISPGSAAIAVFPHRFLADEGGVEADADDRLRRAACRGSQRRPRLRRIALPSRPPSRTGISKPSSLKRALRLRERSPGTVSFTPRRAIGGRDPASPIFAHAGQEPSSASAPVAARTVFKQPFLYDAGSALLRQRARPRPDPHPDELVDNAFPARADTWPVVHGEIAPSWPHRSRH